MIARLAPFALLVAALPALAAGSGVTAGTATANAEKPTEDAFPLHASASFTNSAGTGTFIIPGTGTYGDAQVSSLLVLSGSAKINSDWSASAMMRLATEWTQTDGDTFQNEIDLFDPRFSLSYKALTLKDIGLDVGLNGGYWLPLSMASRAVGSTGVFTLGGKVGYAPPQVPGLSTYFAAGIGDAYNDAGLRAAYAAEAHGKGFVATNGQATDTISCAQGVRAGDALNGGCGGTGRGFRWNAGIGAGYSFLDDQLSVSADLTYLQSFNAYQPGNTGVDNLGYQNSQLASQYAQGAYDLNEGVATVGSLGLSYTPVKWFTLTGGIYTFQPNITGGANGNTYRWFPLWDLNTLPFIGTRGGANDNFSSVFIDTTFSI